MAQIGYDLLEDFLGSERICEDVEVGVLAGMAKAVMLFLVVIDCPVHFPALFRYRESYI